MIGVVAVNGCPGPGSSEVGVFGVGVCMFITGLAVASSSSVVGSLFVVVSLDVIGSLGIVGSLGVVGSLDVVGSLGVIGSSDVCNSLGVVSLLTVEDLAGSADLSTTGAGVDPARQSAETPLRRHLSSSPTVVCYKSDMIRIYENNLLYVV